MSSFKKNLKYALFGLIFGAFLYFALKPSNQISGVDIKDHTFITQDGKVLKLSDFRGKVVLLNFWATWCPPCREEMPIFEREYRRCKDRGFEILAVNLDSSEEALQSYLRENKHSFLILRPHAQDQYPVSGFPTSYLLDKDGKVFKLKLGIYKELGKDLKALLDC
ncbi:MAG: TlpA family protein disulfide reductase [Aquificaceae bacterium]|nr:TlpA family protein disulfide reductase [Aquificaceae bacterium]MDW8236868.1 TlpA disulfide reductase family protein [Aquificaceae bacterium]